MLPQGVQVLRTLAEGFTKKKQTAGLHQLGQDVQHLFLGSFIRQVDQGTLGDDHREEVFRLAGERQRAQVATDEGDGSLAGLEFADHLPGTFHGNIGTNANPVAA